MRFSCQLWGGKGRGRERGEEGRGERKYAPLLHAVEALQGRDGDKDDDCLLAVANFDLTRQISKSACELQDARHALDRFPSSNPRA